MVEHCGAFPVLLLVDRKNNSIILNNLTAALRRVPCFTVGYCWTNLIILDSSMVEHSAVNRVVAGSSPARGVYNLIVLFGSVVKRLRHRPFTAVTRVQFPSESL